MCCGKNGSTAMTSGYSSDLLLKSETLSSQMQLMLHRAKLMNEVT